MKLDNIIIENLKSFFKKISSIINWKTWAITYIASLFFYIVFITQQLTNTYDGLWSWHLYAAGETELSVGRWLLPYLDRMHLGIQTEPMASCIALALFVTVAMVFLDLFNVNGARAWLITAYIMTGSVVICILSYRYTSANYALCILFTVALVWLLTQNSMRGGLRIGLSCMLMVLSLGIYQANIAVAATLMIFVFIRMLLDNRDTRDIVRFVIESALVIIIGCIIYRIIAVLHMEILGIEPLDYKGADNISISGMIIALPQSIMKCYRYFWQYFFTDSFVRYNLYQHLAIIRYIFAVFMLLIIGARIWRLMRERRYGAALLVILALLVLPIACSLSLLLAPEADLLIQMTFSLALVFPCVLSLADFAWDGGVLPAVRYAFSLVTLCFVLGNAWQSDRDMISMYDGRKATESLMNKVVDELMYKDLLSSDREYVIIGRPADNDTFFVVSDLLERTNPYARVGEFYEVVHPESYKAVIRNISVRMKLASYETHRRILQLDEVRSMPEFPAEGSIREIEGYVVVKVG